MAHGDITHVEIPVADFAAATAFYQGLFGWEIAEPPGFEGYPMWQAPNKLSGGGLIARTAEVTQPRTFVEVESIETTLADAVAAGASVLVERAPIDATSAWAAFTDPDGNVIGLYEMAPTPSQG